MNIMDQNKMKQGALRVGVCLLMLSGTNSLYAQTEEKKEIRQSYGEGIGYYSRKKARMRIISPT